MFRRTCRPPCSPFISCACGARLLDAQTTTVIMTVAGGGAVAGRRRAGDGRAVDLPSQRGG